MACEMASTPPFHVHDSRHFRRMQNTSSARPLALHTAAASIMAYAWSKIGSLPFDDLISKQKGGHLQFLTIQALVGAWAYMGLCLVWDLFPGVRQLGLVRFIKRMLLMVALPLAFVVTCIYWTLYLFFPTLILRPEDSFAGAQDSPSLVPKLFRPPLHVDMAMHIAPFATVLADFLVFEPKLSHWHLNKSAPITLLLYGVLYACWVEYCSFYNGVFPYPFLTINPPGYRAAVYALVTALALFALRLLNRLHA